MGLHKHERDGPNPNSLEIGWSYNYCSEEEERETDYFASQIARLRRLETCLAAATARQGGAPVFVKDVELWMHCSVAIKDEDSSQDYDETLYYEELWFLDESDPIFQMPCTEARQGIHDYRRAMNDLLRYLVVDHVTVCHGDQFDLYDILKKDIRSLCTDLYRSARKEISSYCWGFGYTLKDYLAELGSAGKNITAVFGGRDIDFQESILRTR